MSGRDTRRDGSGRFYPSTVTGVERRGTTRLRESLGYPDDPDDPDGEKSRLRWQEQTAAVLAMKTPVEAPTVAGDPVVPGEVRLEYHGPGEAWAFTDDDGWLWVAPTRKSLELVGRDTDPAARDAFDALVGGYGLASGPPSGQPVGEKTGEWKASDHVRGRGGRFLELGVKVRLGASVGVGTVVDFTGDNRVDVTRDDGSRVRVAPGDLTVVDPPTPAVPVARGFGEGKALLDRSFPTADVDTGDEAGPTVTPTPDVKQGNAERLRRYWTTGEGAAVIQWGSPGQFDRCVAALTEHMPGQAEGYCARLYRRVNGEWPGRAKDTKDDAPADVKTGVMVAFEPPADLAEALAVDGGLPPEDLHVTLAYLGKTSDVDHDVLREVVEGFAGESMDVTARVSGVARFTGGDDGDVVVALVESAELDDFRADLVDALTDAGLSVSRDHGFTPHITLTYLGEGGESPVARLDPVDVRFGWVSLSVGEDDWDFPLAADNEVDDGEDGDPEGDEQVAPTGDDDSTEANADGSGDPDQRSDP